MPKVKKVTRKAAPKRAKKPALRPGTKAWTPVQVATLKKLYRSTTNAQIAKRLRRTVGSVAAKARTLKLKKAAPKKTAAKKRAATRKRR